MMDNVCMLLVLGFDLLYNKVPCQMQMQHLNIASVWLRLTHLQRLTLTRSLVFMKSGALQPRRGRAGEHRLASEPGLGVWEVLVGARADLLAVHVRVLDAAVAPGRVDVRPRALARVVAAGLIGAQYKDAHLWDLVLGCLREAQRH